MKLKRNMPRNASMSWNFSQHCQDHPGLILYMSYLSECRSSTALGSTSVCTSKLSSLEWHLSTWHFCVSWVMTMRQKISATVWKLEQMAGNWSGKEYRAAFVTVIAKCGIVMMGWLYRGTWLFFSQVVIEKSWNSGWQGVFGRSSSSFHWSPSWYNICLVLLFLQSNQFSWQQGSGGSCCKQVCCFSGWMLCRFGDPGTLSTHLLPSEAVPHSCSHPFSFLLYSLHPGNWWNTYEPELVP